VPGRSGNGQLDWARGGGRLRSQHPQTLVAHGVVADAQMRGGRPMRSPRASGPSPRSRPQLGAQPNCDQVAAKLGHAVKDGEMTQAQPSGKPQPARSRVPLAPPKRPKHGGALKTQRTISAGEGQASAVPPSEVTASAVDSDSQVASHGRLVGHDAVEEMCHSRQLQIHESSQQAAVDGQTSDFVDRLTCS